MFEDYKLVEKQYGIKNLIYHHTSNNDYNLTDGYGLIITNKSGVYTINLTSNCYNLNNTEEKEKLYQFLSDEFYEFELNGLKPARDVNMLLSFSTDNNTVTKYHGHDTWEDVESLLKYTLTGDNCLTGLELPINRSKMTLEFFEKEYEKYLRRNSKAHEEQVIEFTRADYDEWKEEVRRRYNDTCVVCGKSFKLHTHHVLPKSLYPGRVADLHNGVCICKYCHEEYHDRYKLADVCPQTFYEYLKMKCKELQ